MLSLAKFAKNLEIAKLSATIPHNIAKLANLAAFGYTPYLHEPELARLLEYIRPPDAESLGASIPITPSAHNILLDSCLITYIFFSTMMQSIANSLAGLIPTTSTSNKMDAITSMPYHPLNPLSAAELSQITAFVNETVLAGTSKMSRTWFKAVQLREPPKAVLAPWLDALHDSRGQMPLERLPRIAEVLVGIKSDGSCLWYGEYDSHQR